MVSSTFPPTTIIPPTPTLFTTQADKSGVGTLAPAALQHLQQSFNSVSGASRSIPCSASGTSFITLTPLPSGPVVKNYADYERYQFNAVSTSIGPVTFCIQNSGQTAFTTLPVYNALGTAQLGSGDITAGAFYEFIFNGELNAGAGGVQTVVGVGGGATSGGTPLVVNPIALSSAATQAHGLGVTPSSVVMYMECLTAEHGYGVGDRVYEGGIIASLFSFGANATVSFISVISTNLPQLIDRSTHANFVVTASNWKVVITPYK